MAIPAKDNTVSINLTILTWKNLCVKKTKEAQKSFFFLTKYTMAIPAEDNAVSISLNDTHLEELVLY